MKLFFILILAGFLRLYNLGVVPASVNWDEAAMGYDAYSILKTGKDQFNQFLPLTFRSLNDYKPPLYIYLAVPIVAIFGLNTWSIRLPSALSGIISVAMIYFLTCCLFENCTHRKKLGLLAALFLAVSPWHLQFSRAALESNLGMTIVLAAILLFYKRKYVSSSIFFGLSLFAYHATRFISPFVFLFLWIPKLKEVRMDKKIQKSFFIFIFFLFAIFALSISGNAQNRFLTITNLKNEENSQKSLQLISSDLKSGNAISGKIFHNRRFDFLTYENAKQIFNQFVFQFSPDFFMKGDKNEMMHAPDFGLLYFFQLLFLPIGFFIYLKKYISLKSRIILIIMFLAPLPAALVWGWSNAVRSLLLLFPLVIFISLGLTFILHQFSQGMVKTFSVSLFLIVFFFSFGQFLHQYFVHTNDDYAKSWFFEKKTATTYTESVKNQYDKIIVSNTNNHLPYIFWLFYTKYDPKKYLAKGGTKSADFHDSEFFDKYEFDKISLEKIENSTQKILIVGYPEDFPPTKLKQMKIIKTFSYPDGTTSLQAVD